MRISNCRSTLIVALSLLWCSLLLQACQQEDVSAIALPEIPKKTLPPYLNWVEPEPGTMEMIEAYELIAEIYPNTKPSVCFMLNPYPLAEPGDFLSAEELFARVSLKIDGELFASEDTVRSIGPSQEGPPDPITGEPIFRSPGQAHQLCYIAELGPGLHTVIFQYEHTSGTMTKFEWSFFLVEKPEEAIEITYPPFYIRKARPHPGEVMSVQMYEAPEPFESLTPVEPGICLEVSPGNLNGAFSQEINSRKKNALPWFTLEIDDTVITETISTPFVEAATQGRYVVCFAVSLEPGVHAATFRVDPPSHEPIAYSWPFLLVEEP